MRKPLAALCFLVGFSCCAQELRRLLPSAESHPDLSARTVSEIERQNELLGKENRTADEETELGKLLERHGETVESAWDILSSGCNWYCGGGNYKVAASSSAGQNGMDYAAGLANDLRYDTAWVAGGNNSGIGESIEYYFENKSPRITSVIISNGYMKNDAAWQNNNRVREFKVSANGRPIALLQLSDAKTDETFEIGTLGHNPDGSDLVLKFEIILVYKGKKYNDTAVTEIYFDGIDVH